MRIAVQNPILRDGPNLNFMGASIRFAERHADVVYMPHLASHPEYAAQSANGGLSMHLDGRDVPIIVSEDELNRSADVLVGLNFFPYKRENLPPKRFSGLKVVAATEYVFRPHETNRVLVEAGVDMLIGYTFHDEYDPFFSQMYPTFSGRVVSMPFGFAQRFSVDVPWATRAQRVIGLGSINPVDDPLADRGDLAEYIAFHSDKSWTHQWRRELFEHRDELRDVLDERFPDFPDTRNLKYDAVNELSSYALFANDVGLMNFPPARTYEGVAAGAVLICDGHPSYGDLGFEPGVNYLTHGRHDIADFQRVVREYQREPAALHAIAQAGQELVRSRYSHDAVADELLSDIRQLMGATVVS